MNRREFVRRTIGGLAALALIPRELLATTDIVVPAPSVPRGIHLLTKLVVMNDSDNSEPCFFTLFRTGRADLPLLHFALAPRGILQWQSALGAEIVVPRGQHLEWTAESASGHLLSPAVQLVTVDDRGHHWMNLDTDLDGISLDPSLGPA